MDILGDLSFERGDFEEADQLWRMIVRPASRMGAGPDAGFVVAGPKIDVAGIRAKQILAQLFRGETDNLAAELQAFAGAHPGAKGKLAGRQGVYVDLLKALAANLSELGTPSGLGSWGRISPALPRATEFCPASKVGWPGCPARKDLPGKFAWTARQKQRVLQTCPAWPKLNPGRRLAVRSDIIRCISGDRVIVATNAQCGHCLPNRDRHARLQTHQLDRGARSHD